MDGKTKQKLELFQIPIEEYEKDMKSEIYIGRMMKQFHNLYLN